MVSRETLPIGSETLASMRLYQSARSRFSVVEKADGWWVREDFQIVRRGEKDDFDDWHGPFAAEGEAFRMSEGWNALAAMRSCAS